jgi:hypothetical protein
MRIPHHLSRSSTGRWSFVQRVPVDLQAVLDCRLIKRTLKTKDLAQAHVRAVVLGAGYARLYAPFGDRAPFFHARVDGREAAQQPAEQNLQQAEVIKQVQVRQQQVKMTQKQAQEQAAPARGM